MEVDEANRVIVCDHDVVGFDISMHDVLCVAMINRLEELLHVACSFCLIECLILLFSDSLEQGLARDVLHDEVDVL